MRLLKAVSSRWSPNSGISARQPHQSRTVQDNKVVAEMAGTYDQTNTGDTAGKLVFKPVTSKTSAEHGAARTEEYEYTLTEGAKVLRLVTNGEAMEFHKQPLAGE